MGAPAEFVAKAKPVVVALTLPSVEVTVGRLLEGAPGVVGTYTTTCVVVMGGAPGSPLSVTAAVVVEGTLPLVEVTVWKLEDVGT